MSDRSEVATGYPIDGDETPKKEMSVCGDHREPRCDNCKHHVVAQEDWIACLRFPPTVRNNVKHIGEFPQVYADWRCGEFAESDTSWDRRTDDAISKW